MNFAEYTKREKLVKPKKPGMKIAERLANDEDVYKAQKERMADIQEKIRKGLI